ncbi:MAG: GntR family transcriptional regulator [Clostridia bacterium]
MEDMQFLSKNEAVFQLLRRQIITGELEKGKKYSATELSILLNVSRTPVNYAIRLLEEQSLITVYPNVGFEVKPLEWVKVEELMDIKCQMEKLALKRIILSASNEQILGLRVMNENIRLAIEQNNARKYYSSTQQFHFEIHRLANTQLCLDYLEKYWDYEGWYAVKTAENKHALLEICDEHEQAIQLLLARDTKASYELSEEHSVNCLNLLKLNIEKVFTVE